MKGSSIKKIRKGLKYIVAIGFFVLLSFSFSKDTKKLSLASFEENDGIQQLQKEGRVQLANVSESQPFPDYEYWTGMYGYAYELNNDGDNTITLTGMIPTNYSDYHRLGHHTSAYHHSGTQNIEIPSIYSIYDSKGNRTDYTVTRIASNFTTRYIVGNCYYGCRSYNVVNPAVLKLPASLKRIEDNAFAENFLQITTDFTSHGFDKTTFDLSECVNLEYIGKNAFYTSSEDNERNIGQIAEFMPKLVEVGANAFRNAFRTDYDTNDNINMSNVISIGSYAFANDITLSSGYSYSALRGVNFGSSLESLGDYAFYNCDGLENVDVPETCTRVGDYAFASCQNMIMATVRTPMLGIGAFKDDASLVSVRLSDNTESIPDFCFQSCNSLSTVSLYPSYTDISESLALKRIGVNAFSNTNLNTFKLPKNVNEIGDSAFADCRGLLVFDFSLASEQIDLGDNVLKGCSNLEDITIPGDLFNSCGIDFLRDATLLSSVTFLRKNVLEPGFFAGCSNLTTVNFAEEDPITNIPKEYFKDCVRLSNLSIVDVSNNRHGELSRSIGNIGEYAFYNTAFESITITNAVNSVGSFAFANMQALTYASVNSKDLSYRMFYGCPYLNTLYVGPNTSNVLKEAEENISTYVFDYTTKSETIVNRTVEKNAAFANCVRLENITLECPTLGAYMFDGCMALKEIELKATIRTIETHAFANCQELHQVTLLTSALGEFMFANDTKLKNITLNSNTTTIPTHAFYRSNLENISIPSSVTTVGNLAFAYSLSLKTVDLNDSKMVSPYMFYNCIALQEITIPESVQDNVGEYDFANCATLKYATILNTKISDYMFYNDPLLFAPSTSNQTLVVDSHVTSVGEHAFAKTGVTKAEIGSNQISDYMFEDCENLQELVIGIINSDGILSVPTDIGEYSFKGCNYLSRVTLNLKKIGAHMFEGCTSLTTLTLGSPIERIEEYAFANCTSLSTVSTNALKNLIEIEQYAFANCINLDSFMVPDSVITMGLGVFSNCASLNTITLPFAGESLYDASTNPEVPSEKTLFGWIFGTVASDSSVNITSKYSASASASYYIPTGLNNVIITKETTVLYGTFYGCTMLQSINIPTDTERIESYAFYGCTGLTNFTVPSTVTELGSYVLAECRNLREATLHCNIMGTFMFYNCVNLNTTHLKNVQYVSTSAYEGCISLEIVDLNQGNGNEGYICTSINSKAFSGCINLSTIEFPSTIETIGASAFENCEKLSFITLPSSLTTLDSNAFKNCDSLVSIVIPKNLTDLGESIFVDCDGLLSILFTNKIVGEKMFESCNTIQIVDFQDVEEIGAFAFNECTSLEQLILPKTLKKLGEKAFYHCASIEEVIIPASVVQIDSAVFQNCTNLKYATLLNGKMGTSMFRNCTSLRNVCFEAAEDYPSYSIASYAFYGCHELLFPELPSNITAIGDYAFAQNYRNTRIELPKTIQSLGMNVFWDVNVEELVIPFIGARRTPSYDSTVKGYSRYTLGWIFGASTPVLNSYGVYIVAAGTPYSNASNSYECVVNYVNTAYSYNYKTEKWYLPTSLKKVVVTDATIIPYFAFWSARYITDIEISDTVQTIREGSMYNCTSLKNLTVPFIGISRGATGVQKTSVFLDNYYDQNGKFHAGTLAAWFLSMPGGYHDSSLSNDFDTKTPETTVTAHGWTVAYVASYSRRVSYKVPLSLKNVTVKDLKNNTSIGLEEAAFYNCSMIENIEIIGHLTKIGKNAFYNTGITSFDIASTVTEMGEGAFSGTKSLVDVTIRSSIISKGMFKNSSTLKHVEILGENVVIQDQAFMNCTALQEMNFNQSVSSVGNEILAGCTALQDLYINMLGANTTGNTVTGSTNFGFLFGKTGGTGLVENTIQIDANTTEIRYIPADVTLHFIGSVIPSYAFAGVSSLKKVVLHEGVREIGDYAFLDTTNLEEVRIPSSLEDCGIYVFKNSGLVTAYFGEGIETIYEGMFANCSNLTNLIFESTTTTYEYRYVDHNVFEEYKKVGANGSFLSTGKYVSGGKDLTIGTEDDIENVIRSEEFYIDNQDGTFYAYAVSYTHLTLPTSFTV